MRVVYWGTPAFATPPLRALLGEGFDVAGIVTQPDKTAGRGRSSLVPSPVKEVGLEEGVPVLQPERPRGDDFISRLKALNADINVVVAYGHLLPNDVIQLPRLGTINVHASLLPEFRGAAPIQAAILHGKTQTGVSIMRMVQRLDAGPVVLQLGADIAEDETYGELALRISELGATALIEALALIGLGKATEVEQDEARATYAAKIDRESTRVDWSRDAREVARQIRAYDPKPGAYATASGKDVKLFGARLISNVSGAPGEVLAAEDDGLVVACGSGGVRLLQIQPSGKKRMTPGEWRRGRGVSPGERLL